MTSISLRADNIGLLGFCNYCNFCAGYSQPNSISRANSMGEMDDGANQPIQTNGGYDPTRAAMGTIASCVQLLIRERQNIAFVFVGITTGVLDLLNNKSCAAIQLPAGRRGGDINTLMYARFKLLKGQRTIIKGRRKPEAVIHKRLLS